MFDLNWCCPVRVPYRSRDGVKFVNFELPLPFEDERFLEVIAIDVLEHVESLVPVFQELLRVTAIGGQLFVRGPAGENPEIVWADPTHRRAFARRTFDNFDPGTYDGRQYGRYCGPRTVTMEKVELVNKGYEYTMRRKS